MSNSEPVNVLLIAGRPEWENRVRRFEPERLNVASIPAGDFVNDGASFYPTRRVLEPTNTTSKEQRDQLLQDAHIILLGLPYPTQLLARTRDLQWIHHPHAGTSNLWQSDFWGASIPLTSSRGSNYPRPIAESVIAGIMMFARGLHNGAHNAMQRRDYANNVTVAGKTLGVIGLGGIGSHVAQLGKALGMTVLATRRSVNANDSARDNVDELLPSSELHNVLSRSDFVAVCVMLTHETTGLFNGAAFSAMKPGAVIVNVARGEVIEEAALIAALETGRIGGAYLDVFAGELSGTSPPEALVSNPRVVLTPHVSGIADEPGAVGMDLFEANLGHFLSGNPLRNVIDWERGY